jgi:electron transfer flavoprotein beta subunit
MGADRAIRVDAAVELDALQVARCLAHVARRESPDLVLAGKLAVDDENGQVPAMLAELLGWPQASQASTVELIDGGRARVVCEVDAGLEEVEVGLPAVITADLRLNEPRYASLPGIMKAKKKPAEVLPLHAAGIGTARARVRAYRELPPKPPGVKVTSAEELVAALLERKLI